MKFENKPVDEKLEADCWHEGIVADYKKLTREQALVLLGEKMLVNLLKFWREELFPNCLLKDLAASDEEIKQALGNQGSSEASSNSSTEQDSDKLAGQEQSTGAALDYCNMLTKEGETAEVSRQQISMYGSSDRAYSYVREKTKTQKYKQNVSNAYLRNYQLPSLAMAYQRFKPAFTRMPQRFWRLGRKAPRPGLKLKKLEVYGKSDPGKSYINRPELYRSLESYLS